MDAQVCDQIVTELRQSLPNMYRNGDFPMIINVINSQELRLREVAKGRSTVDLDYMLNSVRGVAIAAGVSIDTVNDYTLKWRDARSTMSYDYNKIWFDLAVKILGAISGRSPTDTDFEPVFTNIKKECTDSVAKIATALDTARKTLLDSLRSASSQLARSQSFSYILFDRGMALLNVRSFDAFYTQMEDLVWNQLKIYNFRMQNELKRMVDYTTLRINQMNNNDKATQLAALKAAKDAFAPASERSDAVKLLAALKPTADTAIAAMRAMTDSGKLRSAVITFMSSYAQGVEDAFNKNNADNTDKNFLKAVEAVIAVAPTLYNVK